ncbi:hypothetical protein HU200_002282 [Digitaria exilis]|uniref:Secreted protein n=1 Tax=Digitaria exilis TaxID=1010633 RepID=A0A835KU17_9POAL|nr:hypothetical protein HU200_002282 [Digitaria exilis]
MALHRTLLVLAVLAVRPPRRRRPSPASRDPNLIRPVTDRAASALESTVLARSATPRRAPLRALRRQVLYCVVRSEA